METAHHLILFQANSFQVKPAFDVSSIFVKDELESDQRKNCL